MSILRLRKKLHHPAILILPLVLVISCTTGIEGVQNTNAFCDNLSQSIDRLSTELEDSPHDDSVIAGANVVEKFDTICGN